MCATLSAARRRERAAKRPNAAAICPRSRGWSFPKSDQGRREGAECSYVRLGDSTRAALMITPRGRGTFCAQAREVLAALRTVLGQAGRSRWWSRCRRYSSRTLRTRRSASAFSRRSRALNWPVTNYVLQPPCCGAALALEAWAIGGKSVRVESLGPHALVVAYDGVRWVYCAGVQPADGLPGVYPQTLDALGRLRAALAQAGSSFQRVVRTWFYLGGITEPEPAGQRYQELNRARTDFYREIRFHCSPAGTGAAIQRLPGQHRHWHGRQRAGDELHGAGNPAGRCLPAAAGEPAANPGVRL